MSAYLEPETSMSEHSIQEPSMQNQSKVEPSMSASPMSLASFGKEHIAVNRFGYGARGDELTQAKYNPKQWVISQLLPVSFNESLPNSHAIFIAHGKFVQAKKQQKMLAKKASSSQAKSNNNTEFKKLKKVAHTAFRDLCADTINQAISSSHSVSWRLFDFFSNHFSVSTSGQLMGGLAATLEREAIAPHLLGDFSDMLLAVEQHPAMLIYLNNEKSFGPNSRMAKKRKVGLNENLAREIMELHTLGVDGGYSQEDVIELAKGITGWSVKRPKRDHGTGFIFRAYGHEPGTRTLLGKRYSQKMAVQGGQMLGDLAMHPNTARHVCRKLVHHFVSEKAPESLINKMQNTWLENNGNINKVMQTLFSADEAWLDDMQKFKTPREFVISTYRALAPKVVKSKMLLYSLDNLGQKPFNAGSPAGYSDDESDWLGASALMARIEWSTLISGQFKRISSEKMMATAFGKSTSKNTYQLVMRAESRQQSRILFLMSPEFQRR